MEKRAKEHAVAIPDAQYRIYSYVFLLPYATMAIYKRLSYLFDLPHMPEVFHNYGTDAFFPAALGVIITHTVALVKKAGQSNKLFSFPTQIGLLAIGVAISIGYELLATHTHTTDNLSDTTVGKFEGLDMACVLAGSSAALLLLLYFRHRALGKR